MSRSYALDVDLYDLVYGGLLYGGICMAVTRSAFAIFGGRSTTENKEYPWNILPWIAEYLAFALCVGFFLNLFGSHIS